MTETSGPVFEVTFSIDREIIDQFDAWLTQHVGEMLQLPGVDRAEVFEQEDEEADRTTRVLQFFFSADTELEQYVSERAGADRQSAVDRFDGRFGIKSRVLRRSGITGGELKTPQACLNCGATLSGQYCGNCGQRAASRLISIWELLKEAFGDLLELDSRVWRTLIPLVIRPGQLTREYLRGRRARYMPPFRTYLVLSVVFFLVAFFDPKEELGILYEPQAATESGRASADTDGVAADQEEAAPEHAGPHISISSDGGRDADCDFSGLETSDMPAWWASRLTPERLQLICNRIVADNGRAFVNKLLDNVPAALFVLLPLMALVLKLLYPLSKRFYVEHLLFVIHFHAFVFLILSLQVLVTRLGSAMRVPELPVDVLAFAMSVYVPVYLYKAQRCVYEQSRFFTVVKFVTLVFCYFAGLLFMLGLVALFAAFSM